MFIIVFMVLLPFVNSLTCYSGSRGEMKGKLSESFIKEKCEDSMIYCIESYNNEKDVVTASCQHLATSKRILDVCEKGIEKTDKLTIRCCKSELCNNVGLSYKLNATDLQKSTTKTP